MLGVCVAVIVPSLKPSARLRRNTTAARGRPLTPEIPTAVLLVIWACSRPSRLRGTLTMNDSYG